MFNQVINPNLQLNTSMQLSSDWDNYGISGDSFGRVRSYEQQYRSGPANIKQMRHR